MDFGSHPQMKKQLSRKIPKTNDDATRARKTITRQQERKKRNTNLIYIQNIQTLKRHSGYMEGRLETARERKREASKKPKYRSQEKGKEKFVKLQEITTRIKSNMNQEKHRIAVQEINDEAAN